ncbi:hypothetical protein KSP40_PGU005261 [Platanthera guangdongensis]|uniref:Uncharacterized protein n=1 Tax=Platanthera guangdongensis TaxID=2320717 RepID=A0ABR2LL70_9ASPA
MFCLYIQRNQNSCIHGDSKSLRVYICSVRLLKSNYFPSTLLSHNDLNFQTLPERKANFLKSQSFITHFQNLLTLVNIQIYRLIKEWTPWDIARCAAFLFFGIISGTEENPEFIQIVESKLDKDAKIIVACSSGGTMRPSQNLPQGQQSR